MVLQVVANAGQMLAHRDTQPAQMRTFADARALQQLGRTHGAGRQNHFPLGLHVEVPITLANPHATDAVGRPWGIQQAQRLRVGHDGEVGP